MADPFLENIFGVSDLVESPTNKVPSNAGENIEGVTGDRIDILDLPMSKKALLKLRNEFEKKYAPYEGKVVIPIRKRNLRSYLGRNNLNEVPGDDEVVAANLQFESEETFLPAATAQSPDPFVYADDTPEGNKLAGDVQTMLQFHAQQLLLRRKMALMARQWSINHLGVLKWGWKQFEVNGTEFGDVDIDNRKIQDFVFDPDGYVDVFGDFSSWLGERITLTAEKLIALFPKSKEYIETQVMGDDGAKLGTEVTYTEWWNDDYCFSTFKDEVLDKHKNEYFNYTKQQKDIVTGEPSMDEATGKPVMTKVRNHFAFPKKPYIFLSVFSLQERPHDITGLIEQNIPNQNSITRQTQQIDYNIAASNNGFALSENNFNQETGKQAADARKAGRPILIPSGGPISDAIMPLTALPIPNSYFESVDVHKNDLRSSWGTQGIASQKQEPDTTARGMTLNQNRDTSRIGGGIVDVLEQTVARACFDALIQLYIVFYDVPHFGAVLGSGKATEYVQLSAQNIDRQLIVGVAPNSMQPKDQVSEGNQAIQLFQEKAIGPKTLLEKLSFPDADDAAGDGVLWAIDPQAYLAMNFPELSQKLQQMQQAAQQAQMQAQQQQVALEGAQGKQQLEQKAQAGQQQIAQGAQAHSQKLQQGAESHKQKLEQSKEIASAKLAAQTKGTQPSTTKK